MEKVCVNIFGCAAAPESGHQHTSITSQHCRACFTTGPDNRVRAQLIEKRIFDFRLTDGCCPICLLLFEHRNEDEKTTDGLRHFAERFRENRHPWQPDSEACPFCGTVPAQVIDLFLKDHLTASQSAGLELTVLFLSTLFGERDDRAVASVLINTECVCAGLDVQWRHVRENLDSVTSHTQRICSKRVLFYRYSRVGRELADRVPNFNR